MEVMSSYCKGCGSYKGPKFGPKYSAFLAKHQIFCRKNHSGSAGGMEVCGMQKIFFRSEQKHGLKYQRYIGDGDSKTFSSIDEKNPYGNSVPIEKIECVGHVQKRMGSRLRKLKALWGKKKLSDGKTIGGKGRLTDAIISKLTTFYGNAIRANSHNVNEMRQAVWAVWVHNNTVNEFSHKNTLPKAVSEKSSLVNVALYPIHHIWHYRVRLRESGQPIRRLRKTCKNAFPRTIPVSFGRFDTPIATESSLNVHFF
ncbi:uncharacterized protein TNCV_624731 [Trichonephila clavipes]|nr:uncharacterized protein TNCV_624731 [Trichonephila clavipes]